eukprot:2122717-Amphidinium_carterae.2
MSTGTLAYLGAGEEGGGDPDHGSVLRVAGRSASGEGMDEAYYSLSEGPLTVDPRQIIVPYNPVESVGTVFRGKAVAAAKRATQAKSAAGRGSMPTPAAGRGTSAQGNVFPRGGIARDRALAAVGQGAAGPPPGLQPPPVKAASAVKKPKTLAELATTMTSAIESLGQRLSSLEAGATARPMMGLQGPVAVGTSVPQPEMDSSSLLAPGRVPPRVTGPPAPIVPAGERAFRNALRDARALMPSVGPDVPAGGADGPGRPGRERQSDGALRLAVEQGGESATTAVQLAMLETLERIAGGDRRARDARGDTLEELLFGGGEDGASGSGDSAGRLGGVKGVVGMQRICQSIDSDPERWSILFDQSVYKALGCDLTGAPWSCARYGLEKLHFGRQTDLKRFWFLLSALHALHRSGRTALLGARISQFLKATEVAVSMNGHWAVAWTLTGIADPEPNNSVHGGLTTPIEVATAIAYMKDTKVLEEASRKATGSGGDQSSSSGGPLEGEKDKAVEDVDEELAKDLRVLPLLCRRGSWGRPFG